jgi:hypothetical protein
MPSMSLSSGARFGPYAIRERLGVGGMGEVWRASDERLLRDVALKVLPEAFAADPERLARFAREAQLLAQLNHPNIAAIFGLEEVDSVRALVMELVEGPTLADLLARGPLPVEEVLALSRQLADALETAHGRGIVHRDLKPANIKVSDSLRLKVLDFGLAKALASGLSATVLPNLAVPASVTATRSADSPTVVLPQSFAATADGVILGTAAYMAPEQAKGKMVDRRADIWAFGVVVYEMLTGVAPFRQESLAETLAAVLHAEIDFGHLPPETPEPLRRLLRRCLTRPVEDRLRDIGDARLDLQESMAGGDPASGVVRAPASHPGRAGKLAIAGLAASLLVIAFLAFQLARAGGESTPLPELRLEVPPPEGLRFWPVEGPAQISPDGRALVFAADGLEADRGLWILNLGDGKGFRIAGSERTYEPFWSPDSAAVGFFGEPNLMRYEVGAGGPPLPIAPVVDGRGASWGSQGFIVFAPGEAGPLSQVKATGGQPAAAATVLAEGELAHLRPQFLPDGRRFLYFVAAQKPERTGLAIASLDDPQGRFLMPLPSPAHLVLDAASGIDWLLYTHDGNLLTQRFDRERLEVVGKASKLAENVDYVREYSNRAFSATPEVLVFHRQLAGAKPQEFQRSGEISRTVGEIGDRNLDLSPDGRHLAFEHVLGAQPRDLWVADLARGVRTRLTSGPEGAFGPVWSADGERIFYGLPRGKEWAVAMRLASGVGAATTVLETAERLEVIAAFPDGRHLLVERMSTALREDLLVVDLETRSSTIYVSTPAKELSGRPSPDGRFVAYVSDESGRSEIYLQPYPATGQRWKVSQDGGDAPRWRGDGRELYYLARNLELVAVTLKLGNQPELGIPAPLFRVTSIDYVAHLDGQRFLVVADATRTASPLTLQQGWQQP